METNFDIIIIGSGPAGLNAALHALSGKPRPKVFLVDKQPSWEKPIACAEGVWCEPLHEAIEVKKEWVRLLISKAVLHSPNGNCITYFDKEKGCIINRAKMQGDMAKSCISMGAFTDFNDRVMEITPVENGLRCVHFQSGKTAFTKIVIDASGPLSNFGKTESLQCKPQDLEPAYFGIAENTGVENDAIHVFLGKSIAPGGYAWAFPREDGMANVGLVIGKDFKGSVDIKKLMADFMQQFYPKATIIRRFAGTIPCEARPACVAIPGFFKAGDAAGTVNPISRAGITEALCCGGMAAQFALSMLAATTFLQKKEICRQYQDAWLEKIGTKHGRLSNVKKVLAKIPDNDYNKAFGALGKIPQDKLTISKIIRLSLGRSPGLVFAMRHLM